MSRWYVSVLLCPVVPEYNYHRRATPWTVRQRRRRRPSSWLVSDSGSRLRVPKATPLLASGGWQQQSQVQDASPLRAELRPSHHPAAETSFGIAGGSRSALLTPPADRSTSTTVGSPLHSGTTCAYIVDSLCFWMRSPSSVYCCPESLYQVRTNILQEQLCAPRPNEIAHIVSRCRGRVTLGSEEPVDAVRQMSAALPSREHANFLCEQAKSVALW